MRMHDNGSDAWNVSQVGQVTRESGPGHCDALQIKVSLISTGSVYVFNSTRNLHELWERAQEHRLLQSCILLINYKPLCHVSFPSKAAGNRHFFSVPAYAFKLFATKQIHGIYTMLMQQISRSCCFMSRYRVLIPVQESSILNILASLLVYRDKFGDITLNNTTNFDFHIISSSLINNYQWKTPLKNLMTRVLKTEDDASAGPVCHLKTKRSKYTEV